MKHAQHKHGHNKKDGQSCCSVENSEQKSTKLVIDPVCGMMIDPSSARGGSSKYEGHAYYFCNPKCRAKFEADPEKYIEKAPSSALDKEKIFILRIYL